MKLPKYDGRQWRLLLPVTLNGTYSIFVLILFACCTNTTIRLLTVAAVPFGYAAFFSVGKAYAIRELEMKLKEKDRRRAVSEVMADLGIKEQK